MEQSHAERNPIDELAEEFAERYRRGERPALTEYTRKHPELADEIREVFPALVMMEQLKPVAADDGSATPASLPERIGDYRLLREIGRGGMGVVYEAEQISLGRHVALKVFATTGLTNPTFLERFRREAKAAAHLHHTNIVPVFGVGESGGVHYYAMQYIHGDGLDKVLADLRRLRPGFVQPPAEDAAASVGDPESVAGRLLTGRFAAPPATHAAPAPASSAGTLSLPREQVVGGAAARSAAPPTGGDGSTVTLGGNTSGGEYSSSVARIGLQVAEALAYAHKQGILHRDIKPSNLILDLQGTVWITDFGLAKAEDADELTRTGDVVGTVRYMAPERFEGTSLPQGDIYAAGMTLYEMLTLRPAFDDANHARLIQRIGREDPPRPSKLVPHIPRDLETIVLKAAAREPADRYATAEALADDLQRFLSDRPIRARRHPALERLWRWCRRNPAIAGAIGVIAASLLVVAFVSSWAAISSNASRRAALVQLWHAKLSEARATVLSHRRGQRFTSLQRIREAMAIAAPLGITDDDRMELRNVAIAALALPDYEVATEWDGAPKGSTHFGFDAALERYARLEPDGHVSVRRVGDDLELFAAPSPGQPATYGRLSPNGRYLAVASGVLGGPGAVLSAPLQVWDLEARPPRCVFEGTSLTHGLLDFSADGAQLACEMSTELRIVDVAAGRQRASWRLPGIIGGSGSGGVKWSPQGDRLAVGRWVNGRTLIEVRDAATGAVRASLWQDGESFGYAWHPDGQLLAIGAGTKIHIWDVPTQTRLAALDGHKTPGILLAFNRRGDRLISNDWNGVVRLWDVPSGRQLLSILGVGYPAFSRDDRTLACTGPGGSGKLQILRFAPGEEVRTLAGRVTAGVPSQDVGLSPDGQRVAIRTTDPRTGAMGVTVLERRTGRVLGRLAAPSQRPLAFGHDGSLWTADVAGNVLRWPSTWGGRNGTIRLGPPVPVVSAPDYEGRALSADGKAVVLCNTYQGEGALIFHRGACDKGRERLIPTGPQEDVRYAALSSDGRWVATGSHWGKGVKVWDAATGRLEAHLTREYGSVHFSPDSRWLLTNWNGAGPVRTGTWQERPHPSVQGDGYAATFAPDSRLLALGGLGRVRLLRSDTGAEVARLPSIDQSNFMPIGFTADGAELLVLGEETQAILIWNLRLIRAQLAELGLDWDDPPLPPEPEAAPEPPVEFVGTHWAADGQKLRQYRTTLNLLALTANPFDAGAYFRLAQLTDDPKAALAHYTASLALQPDQPLAYENRAVAAFRLKDWQRVVADTDRVLKDHPDRPRALRHRGLALQQLGEHAPAVAAFTAMLPAYPRDSGLYELRARSYAALGKKEHAAADRKKAQELASDDPKQLNNRAWRLVTGPPAERDPPLGLKLAQRAVELAPSESLYFNTLGVAQYRNGHYREAIATLERSLALGNGKWDAFDRFFLTMCHQKLGQLKEASDCYDRATRWIAVQKHLKARDLEELGTIQAEAQAALKASANNSQPTPKKE